MILNDTNQLRLTSKNTTLENKTDGFKTSLNNFAHFNGSLKFAKLLRVFAGRYVPCSEERL